MQEWKLTDAQDQLERLIDRALAHSPQRIESHLGAVVMLSEDDLAQLIQHDLRTSGRSSRPTSVSPGEFERSRDLGRDAGPSASDEQT